MTEEPIAALREPGGRRQNTFTEVERAVLRYTDLLTTRPENIDSADLTDLGRHLNPEQIVELVLIVATANWTNRVNDGLHTPLT